jgi:hypothetical protein
MDNQLQLSTLDTMPAVLTANSSLADRAVATVSQQLSPILVIDLTAIDAQTMEAHDQELANLQAKLKDAYTLMNDRRKPFTQKMDDIKAMFITPEKKIMAIGEQVKGVRDRWQAEKAVRMKRAELEQQAALERQQALIEVKAFITAHIVDKFSTAAVHTIQRMHSKFNSMAADSLPTYANQLKGWSGVLEQDTWQTFLTGLINPKPQLLTSEKMQELLDAVVTEQKPKLFKEWQDRMIQERDSLVETLPSRLMELERIAVDSKAAEEAEERLAKEQEVRQLQASQEAMDRKNAIATSAEVETVNASFETASQATPVVGFSKGTVVKRKYQLKSHKAHIAIIQWWVTNCMGMMTLDELQTKLSFMRTAADKALNEGKGELMADGLEIIEDYSTRTTRKREEKVA